ncbi:TRIO and F-actin-binding protein-like [Cucurbita pepo subsp. pepo]|uniref:TRIO and F-actin-binding protein-like n=1 Tax=Cucurbita pepo subsp. pepo TaxID=3664 RepID=UPI000C9D70C1|nr:TRIO and F-actin-binding protein-like [Cucurbita pepo subsp. pepo]XP_023517475.1 TRIO and F-actin-binding protein-like [Cucurbita pepo subsp. pepo]
MFTNGTEGELAMLLDMRTIEKEMDSQTLLHRSYSEDLDPNSETVSFSSAEPNNNGVCSPVSKNVVSPVPPRKIRAEDFMDSENEKSEYEWLLTPPGTPLFSSMESESQKNPTSKNDMLNSRSTALKPRLVNIQEESNSVSNIANLQSGQLNSSCASNRKASSKASAATASRSATPTSRPTLTKSTKPTRSATPTSRVNVKASVPPVRSSTTAKTTARSSTPSERSVSTTKKISRSATPNRCPSNPTCSSITSRPNERSSSTSKFNARSSSNPRPSRGTFPSIMTRPSKPSEVLNFPLDEAARPLSERPASATRGRPVAASSAKSSSLRAMSNGKTRQKPSSPSKQLASNRSSAYNSGKVFPFKPRIRSSDENEVSPVVMGTKMVERVVNMRKLAPPKQGSYRSSSGDPSSKSSSIDATGFGRTLSNKSLDMALRHMDITLSISGKVRPVVTKTQASSIDSGSSRSAKVGTIGVSDSPLATSSNGSSAPSAWGSSIRLDGSETEDTDIATETLSS